MFGGVVLLLVAVGVVWLLLARGVGSTQLDAIRTGGTLLVGAGGGIALLLAARRQRSAELDLLQKYEAHQLAEKTAEVTFAHQRRVAEATEQDAAEKRITELYSKAGDQLGSEKAPVRLTGLYALERLAQGNPRYQQTIANIMCAYLRMPYELPGDPPARLDPDGERVMSNLNHYHERVQEREVRLTAQRILATHLSSGSNVGNGADTFWPNIDLDLTGATLIDFSLSQCHVGAARFNEALFIGTANFRRTKFSGDADFRAAKFVEDADFWGSIFRGKALFYGADFAGKASFIKAKLRQFADFSGARFADWTYFERAKFTGQAFFVGNTDRWTEFAGMSYFKGARFRDNAMFGGAKFAKHADFEGVEFAKWAPFNSTEFAGTANFRRVKFAERADFNLANFAERADFSDVEFEGEANIDSATFRSEGSFIGARFGKSANFDNTVFAGKVNFAFAHVRVDNDRLVHHWPLGWTVSTGAPVERPGTSGIWAQVIHVVHDADPDPRAPESIKEEYDSRS